MKGRKPDYIIKALDKMTEGKSGRLGAIWQNENGTLSIELDPGVSLTYGATVVIKAFPNDKEVKA